jgi:BioD-like phosphotransacetylase family protein
MVPIYIGSTAGYSGKSLVTLGLALKMKEDGLAVGYMKPFGRVPVVENGVLTDGDVSFMKRLLGLTDPLEQLCPVVYSHDLMADALKGRAKDVMKKVAVAYGRLSRGKDVMLIGGARDVYDGSILGIPGVRIIRELGAGVIMVDPFAGEVCLDCLLAHKEALGERLIGAVINRVPAEGMDYLKGMVAPFLKRRGIPLLGMLPADRVLNSISVGQISESLGGTVLCCQDRLDGLVENLSIGAMDVESALKYFRKTPNKAVITGGHRSDIQLAALETSTKCIVLTGDLLPNALIVAKARASGVPLIAVRHDTLAAVERLEAVLGKVRIREDSKVERALELMRTHFDFGAFYARAGIKVK